MNRELTPGEAARELAAAGIEIVKERTGDGTEIRCRCRRHPDPDGHLYVSAVTGAAFCQKCGFRTHLHELIGRESPGGDHGRRYEVLAATAAYYHGRLSPEARHYLIEDRCLSPEVLERFQVGWADGGLRKHLLEERSLPLEACLEAGVLKQDERGIRDFLYHRIVFPNTVGGCVVHLSGRRLGDGEGPKWLHLPGEVAHPFDADALRQPECVWAEGILDVLSLACWGIAAVAGLGTHVKEQWVEGIPAAHRVTVCLDGDAAGRSGAAKAAEALGDRARIALLPAGKDPNDMLCEGRREELEGCLRAAADLVTFEITRIPPDTPSAELRDLLDGTLKRIAAGDPVRAEAYLDVLKTHFHLAREKVAAYRRVLKELRPRARAASASDGEPVYTAILDGLVDLVEHEGEAAFLVSAEGELQVLPSLERDGQSLTPPPKEQVPWLLPRAAEVLRWAEVDDDGRLWGDLVTYHRSISDLPSEAHYEFIATWVMHTYLLEEMQYSPILCFFAVPERGKTRTGKAITYVAYRGIHVESLRDPYIVRFAAYYGGMIFFDVMNLWRKAEREGSEDILLGRFERGFTVPRVLYPERGPHRDTAYFRVFGPTLIGTNEAIHHILDTRAVTITMPEARRAFNRDVTPEGAQVLRERLVAFRARHVGKSLPQADKPVGGRLGDILRPLRQVTKLVRPGKEAAFIEFAAQLQRERLQEKAETLESELLRALDGLRGQVHDGLLPVRLVTARLNENRPEKDRVTDQRVGKRLRSLGFEKGTRSAEGAAIRWDDEQLARAMEAYGLKETSHSAHSPAVETDAGAGSAECDECVECAGGGDEGGAHTPPGREGADAAAPATLLPCPNCHGTRYWRHRSGGPWVCSVCHPPGSPDVVAEWAAADGVGSSGPADHTSQEE